MKRVKYCYSALSALAYWHAVQMNKTRYTRSVQPLMVWAGHCQDAGHAEPSLGVLSEARYQLGVGRYGYVSIWLGIWMSRRGLRALDHNPYIWSAFWQKGRIPHVGS